MMRRHVRSIPAAIIAAAALVGPAHAQGAAGDAVSRVVSSWVVLDAPPGSEGSSALNATLKGWTVDGGYRSASGEELTVRVLPKQSDEFTCSSCFLVHHRSQLASDKGGRLVCRECAA